MIEVEVEEMHGSDRVSEPEMDYERALGWLCTSSSTRAKWRSFRSAWNRVLKKSLTPPTLSEMRFFASLGMNVSVYP
jgi:hypothetical protein